MHTEQETESISSGLMEDKVKLSLSESETMDSNPVNGTDVSSYPELTSKDIASTFPYVLLETPSPITEELPFPISQESPEKKCQNTEVSQKVQADAESDSDSEPDSFDVFVRTPLTRNDIRNRKSVAYLKFVFGLIFGVSTLVVISLFMVKWIHVLGQTKEDNLIMVGLVFLCLGLWSLFLMFVFQFLFVCPSNCEFNDDDVV